MRKELTEAINDLSLLDLSILYSLKIGHHYFLDELQELHLWIHAQGAISDLNICGIRIPFQSFRHGIWSLLRHGFLMSVQQNGKLMYKPTEMGVNATRIGTFQ